MLVTSSHSEKKYQRRNLEDLCWPTVSGVSAVHGQPVPLLQVEAKVEHHGGMEMMKEGCSPKAAGSKKRMGLMQLSPSEHASNDMFVCILFLHHLPTMSSEYKPIGGFY